LFIDGRAGTLEEQAKGPLINPIEMGLANHNTVVSIVESIPQYRADFKKAFKDSRKPGAKITIDEIAKAIATYERTLTTPDSPFDLYSRGDKNALSPSAQRGWQKFQSIGCITCHGAATFSNEDYFLRFPMKSVPDIDLVFDFTSDLGRASFTKDPKDKNKWRVPSLRNVEITGPYFHNGSVPTLEQAVRIMGRAQLSLTLSKEDVSDLVAFLKSLTGKVPVQTPPRPAK
jgi:cytochrome c peroxidase